MKTQEYISSGILESFVLGLATPEEMKEIEKYAATYPEIRAELEEMEEAMTAFAMKHGVTPPSYLTEKIFIEAMSQTATVSKVEDAQEKSLHKEPSVFSSFSYWSIAASIMLLISTGCAVYFGVKSINAEHDLTEMATINTSLSDSIRNISSTVSEMENDLAILKDPMYKIVELKGAKPSPEAKAMVCWCPMDKKVYVEIEKLPPAPEGMHYQLWAIVDGKPLSEGTLTAGNGLHPMKDAGNVQAFEVTLEKTGENTTPKGDVYVSGSI